MLSGNKPKRPLESQMQTSLQRPPASVSAEIWLSEALGMIALGQKKTTSTETKF